MENLKRPLTSVTLFTCLSCLAPAVEGSSVEHQNLRLQEWTGREDRSSLVGLLRHGFGEWEAIVGDALLQLQAPLGSPHVQCDQDAHPPTNR